MVFLKNKVRSISINTKKLKEDAQKVLDILGYGDFDLSLFLTTNKTIRRYNRIYRKTDKPTDILSFPFYPDIKPGQRIKPQKPEEKILGDIIISLERVKQDAKKTGISRDHYLQRLLVHGICHLLGYTHDTPKDYQNMQKQEKLLLKALHK